MVIMDLFPVRAGHALVIPKFHSGYLQQLESPLASHLFELARRTIAAQKAAGLGVAQNLIVNDGPEANQHVPHVHLHLIPRKSGDSAAVIWSWGSRMLLPFNPLRRRRELDDMAQCLAKHFNAEEH